MLLISEISIFIYLILIKISRGRENNFGFIFFCSVQTSGGVDPFSLLGNLEGQKYRVCRCTKVSSNNRIILVFII